MCPDRLWGPPSRLSNGYRGYFPRDADHSPHLVPRSWMSRSYTSSPPKHLHGVWRDCFAISRSSCFWHAVRIITLLFLHAIFRCWNYGTLWENHVNTNRGGAFMLTVLARLTIRKTFLERFTFVIHWHSTYWNTAEPIRRCIVNHPAHCDIVSMLLAR
jgi:hypothetical protein